MSGLRFLCVLLALGVSACATEKTFWVEEGPATAPPGTPGDTVDLRVAVRESDGAGGLDVRVARIVRFATPGPVRSVEVDKNLRWSLEDKALAPVAAAVCFVGAPIGAVIGLVLSPILLADGDDRWPVGLLYGPGMVAWGAGYLVSFVAFPFPMWFFTVSPFEEDPLRFDFVRTGAERIDPGEVPAGEYSLPPIGNVRVRVLFGSEGASDPVGVEYGRAEVRLPEGVRRPPGSRVEVEVTTDAVSVVLPAGVQPESFPYDPDFGDLPPVLPGPSEARGEPDR
jgi:hypothetical protein